MNRIILGIRKEMNDLADLRLAAIEEHAVEVKKTTLMKKISKKKPLNNELSYSIERRDEFKSCFLSSSSNCISYCSTKRNKKRKKIYSTYNEVDTGDSQSKRITKCAPVRCTV